MDEKKQTEIVELTYFEKVFQDDVLIQYLDFEKIVFSKRFEETLNLSIGRYLRRRDEKLIRRILVVFSDSKFYKSILLYFCDHANTEFKLVSKKIEFSPVSKHEIQTRKFALYLTSHLGTENMVFPETKPKLKVAQKSWDMMDSYGRFPGSFGDGKR